jgi:hypothetical protein
VFLINLTGSSFDFYIPVTTSRLKLCFFNLTSLYVFKLIYTVPEMNPFLEAKVGKKWV